MKNYFPEECLKIYRKNLAANGIVVVLPSAGRKYRPCFTRAKWHGLFPDKCFIACADPSLLNSSDEINGTWFLDKEKGSRLIDLANWLKHFIKENVGCSTTKVVFAGSSMGGYASIYLANLIEGSFAFSECPQVNLYSYLGSKKAIEYIDGNDNSNLIEHLNLIDIFKRLGRVPNVHIFVPATDVHHLGFHVAPYARAVGGYLRKENAKAYFKVTVEHSDAIPIGHAPIPKIIFKKNIDELFKESEKWTTPNKVTNKRMPQFIKRFFN